MKGFWHVVLALYGFRIRARKLGSLERDTLLREGGLLSGHLHYQERSRLLQKQPSHNNKRKKALKYPWSQIGPI